MKTILYVTSNNGKFLEVERYIKRHVPEINLVQANIDIEEIQSMDQYAVAMDKAQKAWDQLKAPLLIDDSGIYFNRWHQFPGVLTKFIYKSLGMDGLKRLIDEGDTGFFRLWLVYADETGTLHPFEGRCDGQLTTDYRGDAHAELPYDLLFKPEGLDKTYAEIRLDPAYENYFYRLRALQAFLTWFKQA